MNNSKPITTTINATTTMNSANPTNGRCFTLFVVLPWNEVCSVRNLLSGVTLRAIYCRLELLAGCPAYTYSLLGSDGKVLEEDKPLVLSRNVWDGFMVRVQPLDKWMPVYDGVLQGNVDGFVGNRKVGAGHEGDEDDDGDDDDDRMSGGDSIANGQADDLGAVGLYLACWLGHSRMCDRLLKAGVDPNTVTPFGRSPIFPCVLKDHQHILTALLSHGAWSDLRDFLGDSALDVGKKNMSRQCVNRIHSFHIGHLSNDNNNNKNNSNEVSSASRNSDSETPTLHKKSVFRPTSKNSRATSSNRKTQSAKIITANSNADLVTMKKKGNTEDSTRNQHTSSTSTYTTTIHHPAMMRSNTYSNGFPLKDDNNAIRTHQTQARTSSQHANIAHTHHHQHHHHHNQPNHHHSSQTLSTPRSLKHFQETDSTTTAVSTPRSPSGAAVMRVASPQAKHQTTKMQHTSQRHQNNNSNNNNNSRVRWIETVSYPEIQLSPARTRTFNYANYTAGVLASSSQSQSIANGLADTQYNDNTRHFIGQDSSSRGKTFESGHIVVSTAGSEVDERAETGNEEDGRLVEESVDDLNEAKDKENSLDPHGVGEEEVKPQVLSSVPKRRVIWKSRKQLEIKRKEMENLKAVQRKIQLSENQKREQKKRESFEQWLKKKRRQRRREEGSDESDDDSSEDREERKKSNIEAFNNWLKELEERSIKQTNPKSAISLHKRKTRAIHGLIGISNTSLNQESKNNAEDASRHMNSYQAWLEKKSQEKENSKPRLKDFDERKARQYLDAKRKDILAEAVSFEEWMEHAQDRKTLTGIIAESKRRHSDEMESQKRAQSAKRNNNSNNSNMSFEKWKQDLEAKEAKRKIAQLRMRREKEKEQRLRENDRVSSAIPHDAWVQRQLQIEKEQKQKELAKSEREHSAKRIGSGHRGDGDSEKRTGFETWVNKKHEEEIQRIDKNIQSEHEGRKNKEYVMAA